MAQYGQPLTFQNEIIDSIRTKYLLLSHYLGAMRFLRKHEEPQCGDSL